MFIFHKIRVMLSSSHFTLEMRFSRLRFILQIMDMMIMFMFLLKIQILQASSRFYFKVRILLPDLHFFFRTQKNFLFNFSLFFYLMTLKSHLLFGVNYSSYPTSRKHNFGHIGGPRVSANGFGRFLLILSKTK